MKILELKLKKVIEKFKNEFTGRWILERKMKKKNQCMFKSRLEFFPLKVMFSYRYELNLGASSLLKKDKLSMSMSIIYETDIGI